MPRKIINEKYRMKNYDLFGNEVKDKSNLKQKFGIIPFSVLDTKSRDWKERKDRWLKLGIESELGRKNDLMGFKRVYNKRKKRLLDRGTSVFDPVLCELMYCWFTKKNDVVLDPFSGGSVRGIIAHYLDRQYLGIDIRKKQIAANIKQGKKIVSHSVPKWLVGDSYKKLKLIDKKYDFIFTCPPYFDLEKYSNLENDLSNMEYDKFLKIYKSIIKMSCNLLKENRFACFVVGDVRDKDRTQNWYRNFIGETKQAFIDCGLHLYNEFVLLEGIGSSAMRIEQAWIKKKCIKTHQNILIFYKGSDVNDIRDRYSQKF